jgi:Polycystin cation channel
VIIQLSLYNPNVGLFTSVTFLIEFLSIGGIYPTVRFEPFDFPLLIETKVCLCLAFTSKFQLIYTILDMIFIIYFMLKEFRLLIELKSSYIRLPIFILCE